MGWFDEVTLTGTINKAQTNNSHMAAEWTPQYGSLLSYYSFDGNGPITDGGTVAATYGTNLVAHNSDGQGMRYVTGQVGNAVFVDGIDDYLSLPGSFPGGTQVSFAGWIKAVNETSGSDSCPRVMYLGNNWPFISLIVECSNGYYSSDQGTVNWSDSNNFLKTPLVDAAWETWQHWAFTYDGSTMTVYLNGALAASATWNLPLSNISANNTTLGNFQGFMDEWAFWSTALSPNDVRVIYDRQSARYSGTLNSRALNSPYRAAGTSAMYWRTTQPAYKPLPSNGQREHQRLQLFGQLRLGARPGDAVAFR